LAPFAKDGASHAERTVRVAVEARAARGVTTGPLPSMSVTAPGVTTMAPAENVATPLLAALGGETAASMSSSSTRVSVAPTAQSRRARAGLIALAAALVVAVGVTVIRRPAPAPPSVAATPSAPPTASEVPSVAPVASAPVALAAPVDAGARPTAPRPPPRVVPAATHSSRNPMDLDFR
jgi:hypothetical protein